MHCLVQAQVATGKPVAAASPVGDSDGRDTVVRPTFMPVPAVKCMLTVLTVPATYDFVIW